MRLDERLWAMDKLDFSPFLVVFFGENVFLGKIPEIR